jgi:hypothetical protein
MGDIITMGPGGQGVSSAVEDAYMRFLAEEGLDLLARYRDIEDVRLRLAILDMVRALSCAEAETIPVPRTS